MNSTNVISPESRPRAGLLRRLLTMVYDLLLLLALLFTVTALENFVLNHGNAIGHSNPFYWLYVSSLVLMIFFYYGWFWTHGGQTLGMKTWKIKLCAKDGKPLSWKQAAIYFLVALLSWTVLGIGFLWSLFNENQATWHDLVADCEMLDVS
jgi:uncharacterized RDD family membrane protein YckC